MDDTNLIDGDAVHDGVDVEQVEAEVEQRGGVARVRGPEGAARQRHGVAHQLARRREAPLHHARLAARAEHLDRDSAHNVIANL